MSLKDFLSKQFIEVITWTEPQDGILAWRFPMQDMQISTGAKLTVRESTAPPPIESLEVLGEIAAVEVRKPS